jgi:hypothetical protein
MIYVVEVGSGGMIYLPSFMKIGTGVQAILRNLLIYLRGLMLVLLMRIFN